MLFIFDDTTDVKPNYQKIASEVKEMEKVAFLPALALPALQMAGGALGGYALNRGLQYLAPTIEEYTGIPQGVTNAASWLPAIIGGGLVGAGALNTGRLAAKGFGALRRTAPALQASNSPIVKGMRQARLNYLKQMRQYDRAGRKLRTGSGNYLKSQKPAGTKVNPAGNPISGQGINVGNPNAAAGSGGMNIAGGGGLNVGNAGVFGGGAAQAASQAAPAAAAGGGNMSNMLMLGMMAPSMMGGGQAPAPQQYGGFRQNMGVAPIPGMTGQSMPSPYHASRNQMPKVRYPKVRYPDRGLF